MFFSTLKWHLCAKTYKKERLWVYTCKLNYKPKLCSKCQKNKVAPKSGKTLTVWMKMSFKKQDVSVVGLGIGKNFTICITLRGSWYNFITIHCDKINIVIYYNIQNGSLKIQKQKPVTVYTLGSLYTSRLIILII